MCSLFIIVYLIETSLWVRSLVPAPPSASPALCPNTEGEMASSVSFWKLSSCQSGSDIFTMLPWAHLLCPHPSRPAPGTVSLPSLSSPAAGKGTAPGPNLHVTVKWAAGYRFPSLSFHLALPLLLWSSVSMNTTSKLTKTENMKPVLSRCVPSRTWNHHLLQMWLFFFPARFELKSSPHLPVFFSQRDFYFGNPILF